LLTPWDGGAQPGDDPGYSGARDRDGEAQPWRQLLECGYDTAGVTDGAVHQGQRTAERDGERGSDERDHARSNRRSQVTHRDSGDHRRQLCL
jgi:hypothetical protein